MEESLIGRRVIFAGLHGPLADFNSRSGVVLRLCRGGCKADTLVDCLGLCFDEICEQPETPEDRFLELRDIPLENLILESSARQGLQAMPQQAEEEISWALVFVPVPPTFAAQPYLPESTLPQEALMPGVPFAEEAVSARPNIYVHENGVLVPVGAGEHRPGAPYEREEGAAGGSQMSVFDFFAAPSLGMATAIAPEAHAVARRDSSVEDTDECADIEDGACTEDSTGASAEECNQHKKVSSEVIQAYKEVQESTSCDRTSARRRRNKAESRKEWSPVTVPQVQHRKSRKHPEPEKPAISQTVIDRRVHDDGATSQVVQAEPIAPPQSTRQPAAAISRQDTPPVAVSVAKRPCQTSGGGRVQMKKSSKATRKRTASNAAPKKIRQVPDEWEFELESLWWSIAHKTHKWVKTIVMPLAIACCWRLATRSSSADWPRSLVSPRATSVYAGTHAGEAYAVTQPRFYSVGEHPVACKSLSLGHTGPAADEEGCSYQAECLPTETVARCSQRTTLLVARVEAASKSAGAVASPAVRLAGALEFNPAYAQQYRQSFVARSCALNEGLDETLLTPPGGSTPVSAHPMSGVLAFDLHLAPHSVCGFYGLVRIADTASKVLRFNIGDDSYTYLVGDDADACMDFSALSSHISSLLGLEVEEFESSVVEAGEALVIPTSTLLIVRSEAEALEWIVLAPDVVAAMHGVKSGASASLDEAFGDDGIVLLMALVEASGPGCTPKPDDMLGDSKQHRGCSAFCSDFGPYLE